MLLSSALKHPAGAVIYTTQAGDTMYKISKYYNITLDDLIEANPHINPDYLVVGEKLYIPFPLQSVNCTLGSVLYTVEQGDTIYKLSLKFNTEINALIKANPRINPDALLPGQPVCIPKLWNSYFSESYKISFLYPIRWAKINDLHYAGVDGFFRLSALKSDKELEEICKEEAYHKLKPYGTHPQLVPTTVADCNACMVIPSPDQPNEMSKQAALVIQYPFELIIDSQSFSHVILWADTKHLHDIKNSIVIADQDFSAI